MKITKSIFVTFSISALFFSFKATDSTHYSSQEITYTDTAATKINTTSPDKYSSVFLRDLATSGCATTVTLIDSLFIIDKTDTAFLPTLLARENERFTGKNANYAFQLIIKRNTFSSVLFNLSCRDEKGTQTTFRGEAHLRPCFFMGAEMDEDENGNMYPADEFVYTTPGNLETISFRVGESEGALVKVTVESAGVNIGLDGSPVLRIAK